MNHKLSPWVCRNCGKKYEGYGCDSKMDEQDPWKTYKCEECGEDVYFLLQFRIPEKDIRFVNGGRYTVHTWWEIKVDGRLLQTKDYTPYKLEYTETFPPFSENHIHHWNAKTKQEYHDTFEVCNETIKFDLPWGTPVPDDIFEAIKIYLNKQDVRRILWKSEGELDTPQHRTWPEYY